MTRAFLALGSNIAPREKYLRRAALLLEAHPEIQILNRSRLWESQSVEGGGPGDFLNAALEIETSLSARDLLGVCQGVESTCGRALPAPGEHRGGERTLDVDILSFGDEVSHAPDLELPHPRALRRAFVLAPLLEVLGDRVGWVRATKLSWEEEEA
jgi:2-amino-4-hydroxy-6-hydroxymethyldihydropteridine diphosphokinase